MEVLPAHISCVGQGLHLQRHVSLPPGDRDGLPQGLLSPFIISLGKSKVATVAREEAPGLVGIGSNERKGAGDDLTLYPSESSSWDPDGKLRSRHRKSYLSGLDVVVESAPEGIERIYKLFGWEDGGLGPRQA